MNIDERKTKYSGKEYLAVISLYTKTGIPIRRARTATTGDSILLVYFVRSPPPFTRNMTRWYRVADIDGEKHHQSDATDCKWQEQQPYVLFTGVHSRDIVGSRLNFVNCRVFFVLCSRLWGILYWLLVTHVSHVLLPAAVKKSTASYRYRMYTYIHRQHRRMPVVFSPLSPHPYY